MRRALLGVVALGLCACPSAAPREVTMKVELGPERVRFRGAFRDLRLHEADELLAFRRVDLVVRPEWLGVSELATMERYEFIDTGERLDLEVAGTIERRAWDACVTASKPRNEACRTVPAVVEDGGLTLGIEFTGVYEFPPGTAQWVPADAGAIDYRIVARPSELTGPSAVSAWRAYQVDVDGARRLGSWMEAVDRAFERWEEPQSPAVVEEPPASPAPHLARLANVFVFRKRLALLREALIDSHVVVEAPLETEPVGHFGQRTPLLTRPLTEKQARRLSRAYVAASADPSTAPARFREACAGVKTGELKSLCSMLGVR
jgi:hypothetical protein